MCICHPYGRAKPLWCSLRVLYLGLSLSSCARGGAACPHSVNALEPAADAPWSALAVFLTPLSDTASCPVLPRPA